MRYRFFSWASLLGVGLLVVAAPAGAQLVEPDGRVVPQDLTEDILGGGPCCGVTYENTSLSSLFVSRGEAIEWQNDAAIEPSYFLPLCGLQATLVLRGGGCKVDFGWYNVDLDNPLPPPDAEVYPLVSRADMDAMFASGVYGTPSTDMPFHPWVGEPPVAGQPIGDLRSDPRYRGGLISFATLGNDSSSPPTCMQNHYVEPRLNQMSIFGGPWIMALVWVSTVTPNAFYIGFEGLPTDPDNFAKLTPQGYYNDGDFNDFVYFVEGITCEGGGQPCLTMAEGACGFGLTECLPDATVVCVEQVQASGEICDNLDNDCNGLADDGDLCAPGDVCDRGVCKLSCASGEFPCPTPLVCDQSTGFCVDPACFDVVCEPGQVCMGGQCVSGCSGVVCPWGQLCQLGRCVDPCYGRRPGEPNACTGNMVCEGGVCVESCHCRLCVSGTECDYNSGRCVPAGCIGMLCPEGQICQGGMCVDACTNVNCPGGAECVSGWCGDPLPGYIPTTGGTGGTGGLGMGGMIIGPGGTGGLFATGGTGGVTPICLDTCLTANNARCEDGAPGAASAACDYGTDCADCRVRVAGFCTNTCRSAFDDKCDDGRPGAATAGCPLGTDCRDCGVYVLAPSGTGGVPIILPDAGPPPAGGGPSSGVGGSTADGGSSDTGGAGDSDGGAAAEPSLRHGEQRDSGCGCRTTGSERHQRTPWALLGMLSVVWGFARRKRH